MLSLFDLQSEFILVFVPKWKWLADHISKVLFHKLHGGSKLPLHLLSRGVSGLILKPVEEHNHNHNYNHNHSRSITNITTQTDAYSWMVIFEGISVQRRA